MAEKEIKEQADLLAASDQPDPRAAPEVRYNTNETRETMKRTQYPPGCWVQAGTLDCFKSVDWALTNLAQQRNIETNPNSGEVERVRAARVGKEKRIYIHPTTATDPDGVEVKRNKSGMTINLFNFLTREKLLVPMGKREKFDLVVTGPEGPVGPALRLDFAKVLETKLITKKEEAKKKKTTPPTTDQPKPDTQTNE